MNDVQIGDGRSSDKTSRGGDLAQAIAVRQEATDHLRRPSLQAQFAYDSLKSSRYFESLPASSSDVIFEM